MEEVDQELAAFCRTEHPRLVALLTLQTGERPVAEELAQDALVRVHEHWHRVRAMENPAGWAYTVALNLSRSWWRRRHAERRAVARLGPRQDNTTDDPDDALMLRRALGDLPVRQRTAVLLRYFADLSIADTAMHMRCAEGTVKSLTSQGVAALRSQLGEQAPDIDEEGDDA
ncbi:MAG: SigE family RNA polymerase sigma factor [Acidimicrobiales bacterium]|nr:SigE family RNA polymerase sigma factor [Acidimicrobiales bacterium]